MDGRYTQRLLLSLFLLLITRNDVALGLHINKVVVPTPVAVGDGGWLECEFVDQGQSIYSLKWYLGLHEFYRWTPAENPPIKTFHVEDDPLTVDRSSSHKGRVWIKDVTLGAAGVFRCEVSAEGPDFHTESEIGTMTVVDLPDEEPRITGTQDSYQMHEDVILNCTSPRAQPPASLSFYVNDEPADPLWLTPYHPKEDPETGLETSVLGLRFPLRPRLLRRGAAIVKCTAAILNIYWDSSEVFIPTDAPFHASIMEGQTAIGRGYPAAGSSLLTVLVLAILLLLLPH